MQIKNSSDTLIAWPPEVPHATSLLEYDPYNPSPLTRQVGISFVTPNRIQAVFEEYADAFKAKSSAVGPADFADELAFQDQTAAKAADACVDMIVAGIQDMELKEQEEVQDS